MFDFSNSAVALRRHFGEGLEIRQTLDLQLAAEALHGSFRPGTLSVLEALGKHEIHASATLRYQCNVRRSSHTLLAVCIVSQSSSVVLTHLSRTVARIWFVATKLQLQGA